MPRRRALAGLAACALLLPAAEQPLPSPFEPGDWRLVSVTKDGRTTPVLSPYWKGLRWEPDGDRWVQVCSGFLAKVRRLGPLLWMRHADGELAVLCLGPAGDAQAVLGTFMDEVVPVVWTRRGDELRLRGLHGALTFVREPASFDSASVVVPAQGTGSSHDPRGGR